VTRVTLLDQFRDPPRYARPATASAAPIPAGTSLASALAAGGRARAALSSRIRRTLWVVLFASAGLAALHPFAREALGQLTNGSDPISAGLAVLTWPDAAVQPVLLGAVALVLIGGAVATRGFTVASSTATRVITVAMIAGVVAATPLLLVLIAALVVGAAMLALCIAIGALLGWILISAVTS
jgi:hypothetical protein